MNINSKIKLLAETFTGYSVLVDSSNGANVELSKVQMPCILVFIQENGEYLSTNSHYRDSVNIKIAVLNKIKKGFTDSDVDTMRHDLKNDAVLLYHRLKFDFEFKVNSDAIKYEIVYDEFDDNLIGITFSDTIKERVGINLACEVIESVGSTPNSIDFCQRVSECSSIVSINSLLEDLQNQINNLPTGGLTCADLPNCEVIQNIEESVSNHVENTSNPHAVNLEQARAAGNSVSGDINANSNTIINLKDAVNAQEPITKIQFDTYVSSVGGNRGDIDCSMNPNYPASNKGDRWEVTQAGKIGGASGIDVQVYDEIVCKTNSASGDQLTVGANFYIVQGNIERATETTAGYVQLSTDAETQGETENTKAVTSLKLANWWANIKTLAHTFAAKITFTTPPRFSSGNPDTVPYLDSNKDLASSNVTSTQLNYLDATSSVQTQINSKLTKNDFIDITGSCTFVGWSSYTTQSVRAVDMGGYYIVTGYIVGTSNSSTTTIQIPYTNNGHRQGYSGYGVNNGASIFTRVLINGASDTIDFRTGAAGNAWAILGIKEVNFSLVIEK